MILGWWEIGYKPLPAKWANAGGPDEAPADADYHLRGNNYLFVDGHAAVLPYSEAESRNHWENE